MAIQWVTLYTCLALIWYISILSYSTVFLRLPPVTILTRVCLQYQSDVNANTLACNGAPATGFRSSSKKITVQAGSTVTGLWLHELGSTDSNPGSDTDNKVIASSHKGPLLAYMKKVSDATQNPSAGPGNGWFKISEVGLISSTQWAVDALISSGGLQNVKIPSCIENGDYLLRFELIALHSASTYPGAQFYVCRTMRLHSPKYSLAWLTIQSLG